jgi:hypothetical protein
MPVDLPAARQADAVKIDKEAHRRVDSTRQQDSEVERLALIHGRLKVAGPAIDSGDVYVWALDEDGYSTNLYRLEQDGRVVEISGPLGRPRSG